MPRIKEAKGFFYSLLIIATLVIIASFYTTVWASPSQSVSSEHGDTTPHTPTPTATNTPRPTATSTPIPTPTPTTTPIPVVTPTATVVAPSTQSNVTVPVQTGTSSTGGVVTRDGKQVLVTTEQQVNVGGDVGNVRSSIDVDLVNIPSNASLSVTVSKSPDSTASAAFTLAAADAGTTIRSIGFTINVQRTNVANTTNLGEARITMVAPESWVNANGGPAAVRIFRYAEDGTREILQTQIVGRDGAGNYIFRGISPRGLSVFAAIALQEAPPIAVPPGGAITAFAPGAVSTLTTADSRITVTIPSGAPKAPGWLMYTPRTSAQAPTPLPAGLKFGSAIFDLTGIDHTGTVSASTSFHSPITILVKYTDADVTAAEGNPARLVIYKYDDVLNAWTPLTTSFNSATKTVQAGASRVSFFALVGQPQPPTPTPTVTPTLRPGQVGAPTSTLLPPTPGDIAPSSGLLVGLLIVAFVLIAAGSYYLRQSKQT